MKLLNALEDFKGAAEPGAGRRGARGLRHPAARALSGDAAYRARTLAGAGLRAARTASCWMRPGRKVDEQALQQDEIELVLQINGKHRGSVLVPAAASRQEIEKLAVASEAFAKHAGGAVAQEGDRGAGPAGQRGDLMNDERMAPVLRAWRPCLAGCWPACGFQLRQAPTSRSTPSTSARRQFVAGQRTAAQHRLQRQRDGWSMRARAIPAQVVLDVLADQREKVVVGLNASGQVREFQLRTRLRSSCARRRARS